MWLEPANGPSLDRRASGKRSLPHHRWGDLATPIASAERCWCAWLRVGAIPTHSIKHGLVVIPTNSPQNHSKSNSARGGKYGLVGGTRGRRFESCLPDFPQFEFRTRGCVGWRPRITWCSALTANKDLSRKRDHSRRSGRDSAAHSTGSWHPSAYVALTVFVTTNDARHKAVGRSLRHPPSVSTWNLAGVRTGLSWQP
jgi:hypothetical protein